MKKAINWSMVLLWTCLFGACTQDVEDLNKAQTQVNDKEDLTLEQKFINIQKSGRDILTRSVQLSKSDFQLEEYQYLGDIQSESEVEQLKTEILSDRSYLPYYDLENERILLKTWKEILQEKTSENVQYSKEDLQNYLNKAIKVGLKKIELTWKCDSKYYQTICFASGDDIVYDNIITNTFCIIEKPVTNPALTGRNAVKTRSEQGEQGGLLTAFSESWGGTAYWLFGIERGDATITHTVYGKEKSLYNSGCTASAYMNVGRAEAKAQIIECKKGVGGYSVCNYAYYVASPTISISIQGGGGIKYYLIMSGFGSIAKDSGDRPLYWPFQ